MHGSPRRRLALLALGLLVGVATTSACLPPVPDKAPRTAAFWYLWYPETTTGHYNPTNANPYNSSDPTLIKKEVDQMQDAGIQVGIISWFGIGTHAEATRIPAALRAADKTNFRETLYYEKEGFGSPSPAQLDSDLGYIEAHYAGDANYLHIDGKPVLFVYGADDDSCATTARWAQSAEAKEFYVVQKVFPGYQSCADQPQDWHQYGPAVPVDNQEPSSITISPGFWLYTEATPRLERNLERWRANLLAMKASPARWHLITTWNEFGEGTGIEPTAQFGTAYIDVAKEVLNPNP